MAEAVLSFNGTPLKCPSVQDYEMQQFVDSARNALGEFRGQKVNRRQVKINYTWNVVYPDELKKILNCVEQFLGTTHYYDPKEGGFIDRTMYWGDCKVSTYWTDEEGKPKMFTALNAPLIDAGIIEECEGGDKLYTLSQIYGNWKKNFR